VAHTLTDLAVRFIFSVFALRAGAPIDILTDLAVFPFVSSLSFSPSSSHSLSLLRALPFSPSLSRSLSHIHFHVFLSFTGAPPGARRRPHWAAAFGARAQNPGDGAGARPRRRAGNQGRPQQLTLLITTLTGWHVGEARSECRRRRWGRTFC
jgi:hypothetical protein